MFSMEKDIFLGKEQFIPFDEIDEPSYVCGLLALIIPIIFCLFLFGTI
jgi:hypothetical protein